MGRPVRAERGLLSPADVITLWCIAGTLLIIAVIVTAMR